MERQNLKILWISQSSEIGKLRQEDQTLGPFIRGKIKIDASYIGRVLNKTRTFRINGTFRLK